MFKQIFRRKQFESELNAELSDHLAKRTDDLVVQGMSRTEAERQAKRDFGSIAKFEDEARESSGLQWIDACGRNLRYAVRLLRKNPVFSATVIVTLALCIGANTAIFSVVDAMLFRPLPYPSPERLATVTTMERGQGVEFYRTSVDGYTGKYLRTAPRSLDVALHSGAKGVNLAIPGAEPRYVDQQRVSAGFFRVLGVRPMLGREIERTEDVPGGPAVAVLGEPLWRSSFGSDPAIVGKTILLRGEPYQVVGVMPPGFNSPLAAEVWTPLRPSTKGEGSGSNYGAIARIRDGFTFTGADAELSSANPKEIAARGTFGPKANVRFKLVSIQRALSEDTRQPALMLWAAVGVVLLVGCLNITGLLLARNATRRHEMATRMALGSGRSGLIGQMLAESLVLGAAGGVAGVVLGYLALGILNPAATDALGMFRPASIDGRVLALTGALVFLTSLVFGLAPAWSSVSSGLRAALGESGRTLTRRASWARWGLVLGEVALAMVLLAGAGFTTRTFAQFWNKNPGYDGQGVLTASISMQDARYQTSLQVNQLFDESLRLIRQHPGVEAAGVGLTLPYQRPLNMGARVMDGPNAMPESRIANVTYVTSGYFEALRIGLRRGRLIEDRDRAGAPLVALANEAYLRFYMKDDTEPVGRRLRTGDQVYEIVGIVADVQQERGWGTFGPIAEVPQVYIPASQVASSSLALLHTWFSPHWIVRSSVSQAEVSGAMKAAVAKVDSQLPIAEFRTMDEIRSGAFDRQRLASQLLGILAGLALILASLGVYGLISGQVTARSREFGIRLALGASRWETVLQTVKGGVLLAAVGVVAGWGFARPAARFLESPGEAWRQIHADDPLTLLSVAGILLSVATAASLIPSLRITRIDPARTLREE